MSWRSPWFWFVVVVLLGAAVVWYLLRRSTESSWGFRDVVRDPALRKELEATFAAAMRGRDAARSWDDATVAAAAHRYVLDVAHSEEDPDDLRVCLGQQPEASARHALALLADPALATVMRRTSKGEKQSLAESPAQRACELLEDAAPAAAIPVLTLLLDDPHEGTRKMAALVLGSIGTAATAVPLQRALADADSDVRSYAFMGLERAEKHGRVSPELRSALLDAVVGAITGDHYAKKAAAIAVRWDGSRAEAAFRARGLLAAGSPALANALDALRDQHTLSRAEILDLWQATPAGDHYTHRNARAALLRMLARHRDPAGEPLVRAALAGHESVAEAAAHALLRLRGLERVDTVIADARKRGALSTLPAEAQQLHAMEWFDSEVRNGGIDQYFFDSHGDEWKDALAGFDASDAGRAAILREAVALFAREPSTQRTRRQDELAALHQRVDRPFDDLDRRYYRLSRPVEVTLAEHTVAHAAVLRQLR